MGHHYYIGSSSNIEQRIQQHRYGLLKGTHCNNRVQNAWNKYQTLDYSVLEECAEEVLLRAEQKYLDEHFGKSGCMNLSPLADRPPTYYELSPEKQVEWSANMSATKTGKKQPNISAAKKGKKHSKEWCANISAGMMGKTLSEETKAKISDAKKGKKLGPCSEERKAAISAGKKGKSNGREGKKHSEESKALLSQRAKERAARRRAAREAAENAENAES